MTIAEREQEILRIQSQSFHPELDTSLAETLRLQVLATVQTTLEAALEEELKLDLERRGGDKPRRSGFFQRRLDTQYGHIPNLKVPKLRQGNRERNWNILERYQRSLGSLLNWACHLYVMGLSLRDLQEALYFILGHVLSRTAVNQVTRQVQQQLDTHRLAPLGKTPPILLVDGVWVEIQYTLDEFRPDRAGHLRQRRQAEERVILAVMAVWEDGTFEMLHYAIAETESEASWSDLFDQLIARGLNPPSVQLVVSDGTTGLPAALSTKLPQAAHQRCITHKVRGLERYLEYRDLPTLDSLGQPLARPEAKRQRRFALQSDAYTIFEAPSFQEAQQRLQTFETTWQSREPEAVKAFQRDIDFTFSFYSWDPQLHRHIRTTNHLERLFREFRTKSDEIGAFPNETSCLTVLFLVVQRDHAKQGRGTMAKTS